MAHTVVWASTVGQDGYFREKGGIKTGLIVGVVSCWQNDISYFDSENYRDGSKIETFDVLDLGAVAFQGLGAAIQNVAASAPIITLGSPTATPPTVASVPSSNLTVDDESMHIPPRNELKKRTLLEFWDNAGGTGNVLYAVWADNHESFEVSATPYTFI